VRVLGTANSTTTITKLYLNDRKGSFANSNPILLPPGCFDNASPNDTNVLSIAAGDLRGTRSDQCSGAGCGQRRHRRGIENGFASTGEAKAGRPGFGWSI